MVRGVKMAGIGGGFLWTLFLTEIQGKGYKMIFSQVFTIHFGNKWHKINFSVNDLPLSGNLLHFNSLVFSKKDENILRSYFDKSIKVFFFEIVVVLLFKTYRWTLDSQSVMPISLPKILKSRDGRKVKD